MSSQDKISTESFILASGSEIRKKILLDQNINFSVIKPALDEEKLKSSIKKLSFKQQAISLACAKAKEVSEKHCNNYVVGADTMCVCDKKVFNKPGNLVNAINTLLFLSGKKHFLYSGSCIYLKGKSLWTHCEIVSLKMKNLSKEEIISYLEKDQPFECSGSYRYESLGADLFSSVLGSEFAIQGLAISPLLKAFKDLGLDIKY